MGMDWETLILSVLWAVYDRVQFSIIGLKTNPETVHHFQSKVIDLIIIANCNTWLQPISSKRKYIVLWKIQMGINEAF